MTVEKIYFDMDGVLADFDRGVRELCGMETLDQGTRSPAQDDLMWEAIRKIDHFYDKLELMPGAKEMFDTLREKYGDKVEILTGIPREERAIVTAAEDKRNWTARILSDKVVVHTVCRKHKQDFCKGPETILIDDYAKNTREWEAKNGTGILHRSAEETMKELKKLGIL